MSLTLGLNTALSGLLTSQRGLDVIAQNVVNVNTVGYTRKVMNQESRVLAGSGAGVQEGSVSRMVSEGLLKDIRKQNATLGRLQVEQTYYPRMDDLFGEVGDNNSISHKLNDLSEAMELLATDSTQSAAQWAAVQAGQDVAERLRSMTEQLQDIRTEVDNEIEKLVTLVNNQLDIIHDLNRTIVKNSATATGTTDLEDKRDTALNELSKMLDIQYFKRNDGSVTVYTQSGQMLLDNQPQHLSYSATSNIQPWMTAADGQFGKISVDGGTDDLGSEVVNGQLRAYLDIRDKVVPNLQASLDESAYQLRNLINQVHNRGTSLPNVAYRYEGTRTFANQPSVVANATDTTASIYKGTTSSLPAAHTSLAFAPVAGSPYRTTITAAAGTPFNATTFAVGQVFSISNAEDGANDGTYRVVGWTSTSQITVEKVNTAQTIQLQNTDDVVIATFDSTGNQLFQTTLNTIMQTDYSASYGLTPGTNRSQSDFGAMASRGDWSINQVSAHVESWLKSQGYTNASANLNSDGKMVIDLGTTSVTLAFRDQSATAGGSTASDATIAFDVNGDGATDETVKGFANFFGLNDFYKDTATVAVHDSELMNASYTTSQTRDLKLSDNTGQVGVTINIAANSSLSTIASQINKYSKATESAPLAAGNTSWTLSTAATVTVSGPSGALVTANLGATTVTLEQLAGQLTSGAVTASVVQDGDSKRLRVVDGSGQELTVSITGGSIAGGTDLGSTLDMATRQRFRASVVTEGSSQRLRIVSETGVVYAASTLDGNGKNLISDLGLQKAATNSAGNLEVRSDIQGAAEKVSRGSMQWNSDLSRYYISEGDNSTALELASTMTSKQAMRSSGEIFAGNYSFSEHTAATIGVLARQSGHSKDQHGYQTKLNESLNFQNTSFSGVNLDEEVSAMIDFQQAYSATAKVITVLQEMLETLTSMLR